MYYINILKLYIRFLWIGKVGICYYMICGVIGDFGSEIDIKLLYN